MAAGCAMADECGRSEACASDAVRDQSMMDWEFQLKLCRLLSTLGAARNPVTQR